MLEDLLVVGMSWRINELAFPGTATRKLGSQSKHDRPIGPHFGRPDRSGFLFRLAADCRHAEDQNSVNEKQMEKFHRLEDE